MKRRERDSGGDDEFTELTRPRLARRLRGVDFPAGKQDLLDRVRGSGAEDAIVRRIERMPDREFESLAEVMRGFRRRGDQR